MERGPVPGRAASGGALAGMMFEPQLLPPFPIGEAQSPKQDPARPRGSAGEPGWQMRPPSDHSPQTQAPYKGALSFQSQV